MNKGLKVVKVYGALRKRLGQCRFEFDVATPAQAIKALCVNFPGLDKWLIDSEKDGVGYRVAVSKEKATEENVAPLLMPFSDKEVFSITPVIAGAGGGFGRILLGAALIAVAIANPVVGFGGGGAVSLLPFLVIFYHETFELSVFPLFKTIFIYKLENFISYQRLLRKSLKRSNFFSSSCF